MILDEVLVERTYGMTPVEPTDVVLDIGGNIGAAAEFFLDRGAKYVVSYEPDPDNCRVFRKNMHQSLERGHVKLIDVAITMNSGYATLYTNQGPNKACHSLVPKRGYGTINVAAIGLESAINMHRPTIIKCDIEGGEYTLPWEVLAAREYVRVVVMELHTQKPEWREYNAPATMALMNVLGYHQLTNVSNEFKSGWPKRVIWERKEVAHASR
jgi:FkbM family methyltransferase